MTTLSSTNHSSSTEKSVPKLGGGWPLVGHLKEFVQNPVSMMSRGWREEGELVKFRLGPREVILFTGPEAHDFYFKAPEDHLNAKAVYKFTIPIFGRGVAYDVSSELMDEQLGFLYPALRGSALRRFAGVMFDETRKFADALGDYGEIDLPNAMNQLTINIASSCLIGTEVREQVDTGFADAYHELQGGLNTLGFFLPYFPTAGHLKRDRARRKVVDLFSQIMSDRRRSRSKPDDFMQTLMDARYKDGRTMSDDEITGMLLTVLFAGQHTSAVLATWTCLELLKAPSYLEKIRDEAQHVYREEESVSLESLKNQVVLEYAIRENERMHPPLILLVRKVLKPMRYENHLVPAGALAMVSPAVSHRLPHLFADPDKFYPERFAPPASEDKQHRYALIGFGGGKHMCMGKHFAYLQLKTIWTVLFNHFDFELDTPVPAPDYGSWVTGPELPCHIRYKRRSEPSIFH